MQQQIVHQFPTENIEVNFMFSCIFTANFINFTTLSRICFSFFLLFALCFDFFFGLNFRSVGFSTNFKWNGMDGRQNVIIFPFSSCLPINQTAIDCHKTGQSHESFSIPAYKTNSCLFIRCFASTGKNTFILLVTDLKRNTKCLWPSIGYSPSYLIIMRKTDSKLMLSNFADDGVRLKRKRHMFPRKPQVCLCEFVSNYKQTFHSSGERQWPRTG